MPQIRRLLLGHHPGERPQSAPGPPLPRGTLAARCRARRRLKPWDSTSPTTPTPPPAPRTNTPTTPATLRATFTSTPTPSRIALVAGGNEVLRVVIGAVGVRHE